MLRTKWYIIIENLHQINNVIRYLDQLSSKKHFLITRDINCFHVIVEYRQPTACEIYMRGIYVFYKADFQWLIKNMKETEFIIVDQYY